MQTTTSSSATITIGRNAAENERLIHCQTRTSNDIWFHLVGFASAHVYLTLPEGETINDISKETKKEIGKIVKDRSSLGRVVPLAVVAYTPWTNIKKTRKMAVGEVSFHSHLDVNLYTVKK